MNKKDQIIYSVLSFIIPGLVILAALTGLRVSPFGDHTLAISDGKALYLNYLGYVGRALKGQEGILYSFEKGLGGNMMGSWGWFLLNPFFALFSFFDITKYMQAYTYVSILNFALCGLTMYILLKDIYGHKASNLIFSTAYALNGFMVANVFQVNFFIGVSTLPLVVLGIRKIMKGHSPLVYILSLSYSLLMNFYFGFMLCVASALIFAVVFLTERKEVVIGKDVTVKYIISSLLAGALAAVVWLPALLSLRGGRLDQSVAYAISLRENMPFLEMFSKLFTGANTTAELSNGYPNIFVGILPVFLVVLFFLSSVVKKQKKTAASILLLFYLVSFFIPVFNIAMHGGTTTNWFNYRDSFVFCFLVLLIAAEEWEHLTDEPDDRIKRAAAILLCVTLVVFFKSYAFVTGGAVLIDFAILALMFLAFRMYKRDPERNPKHVMAVILLVLMCVNLFLNYYYCTKNILTWEKKVSEYQEVVAPVSAAVEAVYRSDSAFYRMEIGEQLSGNLGNDPMLYGYNGVGHGGSDERDFVRTELSKLGVRRFNMRNSYGTGIPAATDTLLGLKYIISKDDLAEEKNFERLVGVEDWAVYRNPNALPIAFIANEQIAKTDLDLDDIFENLNRTWADLTGKNDQVFIHESDIVFKSHNLFDQAEMTAEDAARIIQEKDASSLDQSSADKSEISSNTVNESASDEEELEIQNEGSLKEPPEGASYIQYTITAHRNGPLYSYNCAGMTEDNGSVIPALIYEGYVNKGDIVTKYLPFGSNAVSRTVLEDVAGRFKCAYADVTVLTELSQEIRNRSCTVEKIKDSHLSGKFTVNNDEFLVFTIPYDEGWTCWIDGEETEIKQVLGVFMAVDVPEGTHSFEMKFFPTGMKAGIVISLIGLIATVVFLILGYRKRRIQTGTIDDLENSPSALTDTFLNADDASGLVVKEEGESAEPAEALPKQSFLKVEPQRDIGKTIAGLLLIVLSLIICLKSAYNVLLPYRHSIDSSVFEYVGRLMGKGGVMYRDTFDHKGPLVYFINWLGTRFFGLTTAIGLIEYAFMLLAAVFTYRIFRLLVNRILSVFGTAIVLLAVFPFFDSGNTVEEYALPFIIIGLYVFAEYFLGKKLSKLSVILCGFSLGCVLLLRQNMVALWVVFAVAVIIEERKNGKRLFEFVLQFIGGLVLPFVPVIIYLVANHAMADFIDQYFIFNFQYSDVSLSERISSLISIGKTMGSSILIGASLYLLFSKYARKSLCARNLIFHLINVAFIGIAGTTFVHYGIILIPGYILTLAMLMEHMEQHISQKQMLRLTVLILLILMIPWMKFIMIELPNLNKYRYENYASLAASSIRDNTNSDDKIIVCGNLDRLYIEAGREAASKYSYQLPVGDKNPVIFDEFLNDLERHEPEVVVLETNDLGGVINYTNLNKVVSQYLEGRTYFKWKEVGTLTVLGKHPISEVSYIESSSQTGWDKYKSNPVIGDAETGSLFDPHVMYRDGKYYMYVSDRRSGTIAVTTSEDGILWSDMRLALGNDEDSGWESIVNRCSVVEYAGKYYMYYTGQQAGFSWIGMAVSEDGLTFKRFRKNYILSPTEPYENKSVMNPFVMYDPDEGLFKMWYSAGETYEPDVVCYATSRDGIHFEKYGKNPIFGPGADDYDAAKVSVGHIEKLANNEYVMFYIGYKTVNEASICIAKSDNGIDWVRSNENPIVMSTANTFDQSSCYKPSVVYDEDNDEWKMWYNGRNDNSEYIGLCIKKGSI